MTMGKGTYVGSWSRGPFVVGFFVFVESEERVFT